MSGRPPPNPASDLPPDAQGQLGPLRWGWSRHRRGTPAEPPARAWLAAQLGVAPADLPLVRDPRGRPQLLSAGHDCSWSHSGDGLLVALGADVLLGVDCERLHARPRALDLADRYFTAPERDWLGARAEGPARDRAFLRLWCAKEAVLKAHGHGLVFGLHRLRFVETEQRLQLAECDAALGRAEAWTLHEFAPAPGYLAALAWRGLAPGAAASASPRHGTEDGLSD